MPTPTPYVIVYNGLVLAEQQYFATYADAQAKIDSWVAANKYCADQYRVVGLAHA